jgi:hypothetical protein
MAVSAIKRSTPGTNLFKYSYVYEGTQSIDQNAVRKAIQLNEQEELICSTIITATMWTVLTTRRIITQDGKNIIQHPINGMAKRELGGFRDHSEHEFIKGTFEFNDGDVIPFFVEGGKSSMIMIYATQTMMNLSLKN